MINMKIVKVTRSVSGKIIDDRSLANASGYQASLSQQV